MVLGENYACDVCFQYVPWGSLASSLLNFASLRHITLTRELFNAISLVLKRLALEHDHARL
jgi:hypothetical protein